MRTWMASVWILAALAVSLAAGPAAAAQTVWRCERADGGLVFQGEPCGAGTHPRGTRVFDTPDHPEALMRLRAIEREMDRRNAELHRPAPMPYARRSPARQRPAGRATRWRECGSARRVAHAAVMAGAARMARQGRKRRAVDACFGL